MVRQSDSVPLLARATLLGLLPLFWCGHVCATPIYKSVDAAGNVTYSASPPADAVQFERVEMPDEGDVGSSAAHAAVIDEIRATADLLESERKQREQAREAARAKRESEADKQVTLPPQPVIQYYPVYPARFRYPHRPRSHRHPSRRQLPDQPPDQRHK